MSRRIGLTRWIGQSGVIEMIAAQFGFAMIPRWPASAPALISGTTSGTAGSIRNAEELSTTTAPAATASGAKRFEMPLPAEKRARSAPSKALAVSARTGSPRLPEGRVLPAERAEAKSRRSARGKPRAFRHLRISIPTAPVAPTTATVGFGRRGRNVAGDGTACMGTLLLGGWPEDGAGCGPVGFPAGPRWCSRLPLPRAHLDAHTRGCVRLLRALDDEGRGHWNRRRFRCGLQRRKS